MFEGLFELRSDPLVTDWLTLNNISIFLLL